MHISIEFDVKFGSSYQRKFFLSTLKALLYSTTLFSRGSHKKNKVYYDIFLDERLDDKFKISFEEQT